MNATNIKGHEWNGEKQDGEWLYTDESGNLYSSKEIPAYRIIMDNSTIVTDAKGRRMIVPIGQPNGWGGDSFIVLKS